MSKIVLEAVGIKKLYKNGPKYIHAVDGIDFKISGGESMAIVGPSGAGKSTLLHILGGLDRPTSGNVLVDSSDIYKMGDSLRSKIRNKRIGFVFQFYNLLPEFTALENVVMPSLIYGSARSKAKEDAVSLLKSVGLGARLNHKPGELSGGESQRVALARAMINAPDIMLCDEPTGNLDSKNSSEIYTLLFDMQKKHGMSLVIVTHDEHISKSTDRTIHLKDGKVV